MLELTARYTICYVKMTLHDRPICSTSWWAFPHCDVYA